jgi:hypothetical protein
MTRAAMHLHQQPIFPGLQTQKDSFTKLCGVVKTLRYVKLYDLNVAVTVDHKCHPRESNPYLWLMCASILTVRRECSINIYVAAQNVNSWAVTYT